MDAFESQLIFIIFVVIAVGIGVIAYRFVLNRMNRDTTESDDISGAAQNPPDEVRPEDEHKSSVNEDNAPESKNNAPENKDNAPENSDNNQEKTIIRKIVKRTSVEKPKEETADEK